MPVHALIPYAHVADVERAIGFYRVLGLEVVGTHEHEGRLVWAHLARGEARLMLALADGPFDASQQSVLFYCWSDDLSGLRDALLAAGVDAGAIEPRFYMPGGELRLVDPDGYVVLVGQTT